MLETIAAEPGLSLCGCDVVRSFVQERKFVAKFMAVVSSDSILISVVW